MSIFEIRDPNTGVLRLGLDPTTGAVTGAAGAITGADDTLQGLAVPAPTEADDGKVLSYDHSEGTLAWIDLPS
jgi:hypothetical protein